MAVKIFYDLETTGLDYKKHGIHHLGGIIEVDGVVAEAFDFKVRPNPKAQIAPEAMSVGGVTEELLQTYPPMEVVFKQFITLINKYLDRYDPKSKAYLVGFNNRAFDDFFLRAWFDQNGNTFYSAYFWTDSLDVMVLAAQYLIERREAMPSFKLKRVALELGIEVDKDALHDASYDIHLTREIYRIVTGLEVEI
jgi:DNA polymerase-3 subunit epsilon